MTPVILASLAIFVALIGYAASCAVRPFAPCRICHNQPRTSRARRGCRRCHGTGYRLRIGRRVYHHARRTYHATNR